MVNVRVRVAVSLPNTNKWIIATKEVESLNVDSEDHTVSIDGETFSIVRVQGDGVKLHSYSLASGNRRSDGVRRCSATARDVLKFALFLSFKGWNLSGEREFAEYHGV